MTVCYVPHTSGIYTGIGTDLTNGDSYVYIENHLGQDPCGFADSSGNWCVALNLANGTTDACGTSVTYPTVRKNLQ